MGIRVFFIVVVICALAAGCTDYGRECVMHIGLLDENGKPVPGRKLKLLPGSAVRADNPDCVIEMGDDGTALFMFLQKWSGRSKPPTVELRVSSCSEPMVMAEDREGYFIITQGKETGSVRTVTKEEFEKVFGTPQPAETVPGT